MIAPAAFFIPGYKGMYPKKDKQKNGKTGIPSSVYRSNLLFKIFGNARSELPEEIRGSDTGKPVGHLEPRPVRPL
jgi:hypothetical protein